MTTETTTTVHSGAPRGWVLYDAECGWCVGLARRMEEILRRHHFALMPLQTPWVGERLGLKAGAPLREMGFLRADGGAFRGAEALAQIAGEIWWSRPLYFLTRLPGVMPLFHRAYLWVADRRHCRTGAECRIRGTHPNPLVSRRRRKRVFFDLP